MPGAVHAFAETARAGLYRAGRQLLAASPTYSVLRRRALAGRPVTVLCYHTLGAGDEDMDAWTVLRAADFRQQMACLHGHYDIVSLDDALSDKPGGTHRPRAVVTFDDGDAGLHRHLLPYLREHPIPVTVYVATGQIETGRAYWFDQIMNAAQTVTEVGVDLTSEGLGTWRLGSGVGPRNWTVISGLLEALKSRGPVDRARIVGRVLERLAAEPRRAVTPLRPMSRDELQELAAEPCVTIGAHSHCHNLLDQLALDHALESIRQSRALLRQWTGQPVQHFAYPNGNWSPDLAESIAACGFRSATRLGMSLWRGGDPYAIPRVAIGRYDDADRFKLRLAEV